MKKNSLFSSSKWDFYNSRQFPFHISDTIGVSEDARTLHWHDEIEICYVKQGTGKYLINGREYAFEAGDVFIINNDEIHLAYDDKDLVIQVTLFHPSMLWAGGSYVMDYEYLKPFLEIGRRFSNKLSNKHEHITDIIEVLKDIQLEYQSRQQGFELMIKSMLLKFMTLIIRYFDTNEEMGLHEKISNVHAQNLMYSIDYIEQNYNKNIMLDELAKLSGMSVSHFCHIFKKFSGLAPMEYIVRIRIAAAKQLLKVTNKKVVEISLECGFNCLSNFNRSFKIYTGVSPRIYRES
jgi:AraC-like DNA-binding protein